MTYPSFTTTPPPPKVVRRSIVDTRTERSDVEDQSQPIPMPPQDSPLGQVTAVVTKQAKDGAFQRLTAADVEVPLLACRQLMNQPKSSGLLQTCRDTLRALVDQMCVPSASSPPSGPPQGPGDCLALVEQALSSQRQGLPHQTLKQICQILSTLQDELGGPMRAQPEKPMQTTTQAVTSASQTPEARFRDAFIDAITDATTALGHGHETIAAFLRLVCDSGPVSTMEDIERLKADLEKTKDLLLQLLDELKLTIQKSTGDQERAYLENVQTRILQAATQLTSNANPPAWPHFTHKLLDGARIHPLYSGTCNVTLPDGTQYAIFAPSETNGDLVEIQTFDECTCCAANNLLINLGLAKAGQRFTPDQLAVLFERRGRFSLDEMKAAIARRFPDLPLATTNLSFANGQLNTESSFYDARRQVELAVSDGALVTFRFRGASSGPQNDHTVAILRRPGGPFVALDSLHGSTELGGSNLPLAIRNYRNAKAEGPNGLVEVLYLRKP